MPGTVAGVGALLGPAVATPAVFSATNVSAAAAAFAGFTAAAVAAFATSSNISLAGGGQQRNGKSNS